MSDTDDRLPAAALTACSPYRRTAVGLLLQLALVIGMGATLVAMMRTFLRLDASEDVSAAAASITLGLMEAVRWTSLSLPIALVGLVVLALELREGRGRTRWVYRGTFASLVCWSLLFPLGTIIGVAGLCWLIRRRQEFRPGEPGVRSLSR